VKCPLMKGELEIEVLCSAFLHSFFTEEHVLLCTSSLSTSIRWIAPISSWVETLGHDWLTMFRPIRIRAGSDNFYPNNTPLRFVNATPSLRNSRS
jgi:hypothetical protein